MSIFKRVCGKVYRGLCWLIFSIFPINSKRIIISNFNGNGFADSPKYICQEIIKKNPGCEIIWVVKNINYPLPSGIKKAVINTAQYFYYLSTAKVWIDNSRKIFWKKKKNQFYLQTWHGFALKRIERDVLSTLHPGYERLAKKDASATDVMISDSKFMSKLYRKSFWYKGEIKEIGLPRYDIVLNGDSLLVERVYRALSIDPKNHLVLYAPTFRQDYSLEAYKLDFERIIKAFENKFKHNYIMLVRLHPNVSDKADFINYNNKVVNATNYPDLQELLFATDFVISDYSSLMIDFAITYKPCFIFATDIENYKGERNFYFDITRLPFPVSTDNKELEEQIENLDIVSYKTKVDEFIHTVGMVINPNCAAECAKIVLEQIKD